METLFDVPRTEEKRVLMSIVTKQVNKILAGTKQWEFRKNIPRINDDEQLAVVMYSSQEDKAVVGGFNAGRILRCSLDELMQITGYADDEKALAWFKGYYGERSECCAIEVVDPVRYASPIGLTAIREAVPNFMPPQNFIYLQPEADLTTFIDQQRA